MPLVALPTSSSAVGSGACGYRCLDVLAILVAAVLTLLALPPRASAGTYDVYSCRLPDGTPIPASGWFAFGGAATSNRCTSTGGLTVSLHAAPLLDQGGGWVFEAPYGTQIAGFEIQRAAFVLNGPRSLSNTYSVSNYYSTLDHWPPPVGGSAHGERCVRTGGDSSCDSLGSGSWEPDPDDVYERRALRHARLYMGTVCSGPEPCGPSRPDGPRTTLIVHAARFTLRDQLPPRFTRETAMAGSQSRLVAGFSISDDGGGIVLWRVLLDGGAIADEVGADLRPSCQEPFVDTVPCPTSRELELSVETSSLNDGEHELRALAVDAAGNATWSEKIAFFTRDGVPGVPAPVAAPAPSFTLPVGVPSPTSAELPSSGPSVASRAGTSRNVLRLRAWFRGRSRSIQRTLRFGEATMVQGVLTGASGTPIAGAAIDVRERDIGIRGRSRSQALARTDASGRFSHRVASGPSRVVEFSHRAAGGDPAAIATSRLTVRVRAGVTLRTSRARVRNGTVLRFSGRIFGEPGTRRALVTIYALGGGPRKRIPVETVRARSDGRFAYAYRFSRIPGPSVYRFEARVPKQTGFPYLEGASRVVSVHGRP